MHPEHCTDELSSLVRLVVLFVLPKIIRQDLYSLGHPNTQQWTMKRLWCPQAALQCHIVQVSDESMDVDGTFNNVYEGNSQMHPWWTSTVKVSISLLHTVCSEASSQRSAMCMSVCPIL